jgi:Ca-activated chloride channel homolog
VSGDDEIVAWYAEQRLSPESVARLAKARPPARTSRWWLWAAAAAAGAAVGIGAWTLRPRPETTLPALPIRYAEALPVKWVIRVPEGMLRTEISIADGQALSGFLSSGTYVDILHVVPGEPKPQTVTLFQSLIVLDVVAGDAAKPRLTLLTTPDQDRVLRRAATEGDLVATLRNDLDVSMPRSALLAPRPTPAAPLPSPRSRDGDVAPKDRAIRTTFDAVSTFGMDVDTASYTFARSRLGDGSLPDPASIRVEEFVNALPYDYPRPDRDLFAAQFEVVPSPWTKGYHVVRMGIRARDIPDDQRPPLHLVFLVDTSGSMSSQLWLVERSLRDFVEVLEPTDTVGIVSFSDQARVLLPPTSLSDRDAVDAGITALEIGGGTGLEAGLQAAYPLAAGALERGGEHRVVLVTDGMANIGESDAAALSGQIRAWTRKGIGLTALGFGRGGYRDELMETLADASDGNYAYIDSPDQARDVLGDHLIENLVVLARDAKVQVTWDADVVEGWRQIGYDDRRLASDDFRDDAADAGEIGPGHRVTALYEVRLLPGAVGPLGTLDIRAEPPGPEGQQAIEQRFSIDAAPSPTFEDGSADTRMAIAAASIGLYLAESPIVALDLGRIQAMARAAERPEYADGDTDLARLIYDASEARPRRAGTCREFTILSGGAKKILLVDDNGIPCD